MPVLADPVTPLLWRACLAGDDTLIDEELHSGRTDPHALDRNGESCLHMAARGGSTKGLERLLEEGLRIDHANHNRQTALHVAVNIDNLNIVKIIAQHGGNLALTTKFSGMTALHLACRLGNEEIVQVLLDSGANCAIRDKIQKWPDHYARNKTILYTFDKHFDVCTHGRGKQHGSLQINNKPSVTRDAAGVAVIDDNTEMERLKAQERHMRGRDGPKYGNIQHGDVEIFDENVQYDPDKDGTGTGAIKRNDKKWKINHKMDFSDQHKQRMQQNVFDRLLHASKRKEST